MSISIGRHSRQRSLQTATSWHRLCTEWMQFSHACSTAASLQCASHTGQHPMHMPFTNDSFNSPGPASRTGASSQCGSAPHPALHEMSGRSGRNPQAEGSLQIHCDYGASIVAHPAVLRSVRFLQACHAWREDPMPRYACVIVSLSGSVCMKGMRACTGLSLCLQQIPTGNAMMMLSEQ